MQLQRLRSPLVACLLALQRMQYMYAPVYDYFTNPVSVLFVCIFMSSSLSSSLLVIYVLYINVLLCIWQAMPNFYCKNCKYKQHQCFVCGELGSSDKSSGAAEVSVLPYCSTI